MNNGRKEIPGFASSKRSRHIEIGYYNVQTYPKQEQLSQKKSTNPPEKHFSVEFQSVIDFVAKQVSTDNMEQLVAYFQYASPTQIHLGSKSTW